MVCGRAGEEGGTGGERTWDEGGRCANEEERRRRGLRLGGARRERWSGLERYVEGVVVADFVIQKLEVDFDKYQSQLGENNSKSNKSIIREAGNASRGPSGEKPAAVVLFLMEVASGMVDEIGLNTWSAVLYTGSHDFWRFRRLGVAVGAPEMNALKDIKISIK
ncbi:Protein of unknown function [Gryllus bimaculatus]|nr:Protein of unknown function [Gryllus bimaculatus]